jgi:ABC-type multidrug transport system ATPase subunit
VTNEPTLELRDATLRRAGAALTAALSFSSALPRVGLVGDWSALLQALIGQAQVSSGSVRVLGQDLRSVLAEGVLGLAMCDPPLPGSFTVTEYLQHAARLSHGSASRAIRDTKHVLDRFGLNELASRKLTQTTVFQQRALGIALACLTSPPVVWLECPLRGLDAPAADYVARLCLEAGVSSRVILSTPLPSSPSAERSLLETCDELFLLERGLLVARGTPGQVLAANGRYLLSLCGANTAAYEGTLREAGCVVTARDQLGDYVIELPPNESTDLLLDAALAHDVIVLELEPLHGPT